MSNRVTGTTRAIGAIRATWATAAGALIAAMLLSSCAGSSDGSKSGEIEGAAKGGGRSSSPSASASSDAKGPKAPRFDFPGDLRVKIDADTTGDATKDAVLRDNGYAIQAIFMGFAKQDPRLPELNRYLGEQALLGFSDGIANYKKRDMTITGSVRFYKRTVKLSGKNAAAMTYCEDQRKAYDKNAKSGKVYRTTPSAKSFVAHTAAIKKSPAGVWVMVSEQSTKGAAQCRL